MKKKQNLAGPTRSFLLELRVEDIPARFLAKTQEYLQGAFEQLLKKVNTVYQATSLAVWVTPCRIVFYVELENKTLEIKTEELGPRGEIKDAAGNYLPQALAFAKAKGLRPEDLYPETTEKGKYIGYRKVVPARPVIEILKTEFPKLILSTPFPKTMRWDETPRRFARPIRSILVLWDNKILKDWNIFEGVSVSEVTKIGEEKIKISHAGDYRKKLQSQGLFLDHRERKADFNKELAGIEPNLKAVYIESRDQTKDSLEDEMLRLVERPEPMLGDFNPEFLVLPKDVILAILEKIKVLGVEEVKSGKFCPKFLCAIDRPGNKSALKNIRHGYEVVVNAKLFDAKFFWDQDQKKPLSAYVEALKGIVWSKELGSVWDKAQRMRLLAAALIARPALDVEHRAALDRAIQLYYADTATTLVGEYPDLAGRVGYYYALHSPETNETREILKDLQDGSFKTMGKAAIVAMLAVCLDTLVAQFAIGNKPSAKEDPLGLKRVADGLIELLWERGIVVSLKQCVDLAQETLPQKFKGPRPDLLEYLEGRVAVKLVGNGFGPDRVDSLLSGARFKDFPITEIRLCADAFKELEAKHLETLAALAATFKRTSNILRQVEKQGPGALGNQVEESLLQEGSERLLWQEIQKLQSKSKTNGSAISYPDVFASIAQVAPPLEGFFKDVMVLCEDEALRKNRLALLATLRDLVLEFLDPSKLVISNQ